MSIAIVRFNENMLDACTEFWWEIYEHMPYVHRPDGYLTINIPPVGPWIFVKHLKAGLSCHHTQHWEGEVNNESIFLASNGEKVEGILVSSIDRELRSANILSAYVQRNNRDRKIVANLLNEAVKHFRKLGLRRVVAGPGPSKSLEVECPIHLALLDAGFAWENDWEPAFPKSTYDVFLGGSLEGFRLQPKIKEKIKKLRKEGITIERCTADQFRNLRRLDTGHKPPLELTGTDVTFVALVDGLLVGWLFELLVGPEEDLGGIVTGKTSPYVISTYRRRGMGKALYHLGMEEVVRQGAKYGSTATGIYSPARLIYQSIGYRYWCTSFNMMTKYLP